MSGELYNKVFDVLEKSLDIRTKRQSIIASNIANQDTPGYRAKEIDFQKSLAAAMGTPDTATERLSLITTDGKHIPIEGDSEDIEITADDSTSIGNDGNTVDIDKEMGKLQKNSGMYDITTELLKYKFRSIKSVLENEK